MDFFRDTINFIASHIMMIVQKLAGQVGKFHPVSVNDAQMSYPGGSKYLNRRAPKTACPHDCNTGVQHIQHPLRTDIRNTNLPIIAHGITFWEYGCHLLHRYLSTGRKLH